MHIGNSTLLCFEKRKKEKKRRGCVLYMHLLISPGVAFMSLLVGSQEMQHLN